MRGPAPGWRRLGTRGPGGAHGRPTAAAGQGSSRGPERASGGLRGRGRGVERGGGCRLGLGRRAPQRPRPAPRPHTPGLPSRPFGSLGASGRDSSAAGPSSRARRSPRRGRPGMDRGVRAWAWGMASSRPLPRVSRRRPPPPIPVIVGFISPPPALRAAQAGRRAPCGRGVGWRGGGGVRCSRGPESFL